MTLAERVTRKSDGCNATMIRNATMITAIATRIFFSIRFSERLWVRTPPQVSLRPSRPRSGTAPCPILLLPAISFRAAHARGPLYRQKNEQTAGAAASHGLELFRAA